MRRTSVSLLIVDDHDVVTWGFRFLLVRLPWVTQCLQAKDGAEAVELARRYGPHVSLIDLDLDRESGIAVCARVQAACPHTQLLLMSGGAAVPDHALKAVGAAGFISKAWEVEDTISVIRAVGLGLSFNGAIPAKSVTLSHREQDVLAQIATGATNREIAETLYLSPHTVKQHASAAFRKLNARNRLDAVQRARRLGFVP
jgi:DNA-binding NarL/FixJ family response regulator